MRRKTPLSPHSGPHLGCFQREQLMREADMDELERLF